jgi:hypothetical protein
VTVDRRARRLFTKGDASDSSGFGNNGVTNGNLTFIAGESAPKLSLDGVSDTSRIPV